jgi:hypothetical protein
MNDEAENVTMCKIYNEPVKITSTINPICEELGKLLHKDLSIEFQKYVDKTYIICAFMHNDSYPIRCASIKMDISDPLFNMIETESEIKSEITSKIWNSLFLSVLLSGNVENNYKYPYSKSVMKNCNKSIGKDFGNQNWERVILTFPFCLPLTYENRMGFYYVNLDLSIFDITEGHNLAIGCSIFLQFIQKNVWGAPKEISHETVFKYIKSPEKELSKNSTAWQRWKNSVFQNIVEHFNIEKGQPEPPGFLFICRAGELFKYSIQFIEHYLSLCSNVKTRNLDKVKQRMKRDEQDRRWMNNKL